MRFRNILMGSALSFLVSGCALEKGSVVERVHEPAVTEILIYPCVFEHYDKVMRGKVPVMVSDDEDFRITITDKKGKRTATFYVKDRAIFDGTRIGGEFEYSSDIAEKYDSNNKKRLTLPEYERFVK